jgi:hypothetical protein
MLAQINAGQGLKIKPIFGYRLAIAARNDL